MKQQDIAILIIIVFFASIFSFVVSNKYISPSDEKLSAETVSAIVPEFSIPDKTVFNSDAINPTVRIEIAPITNPQPFTNKTN
jgi:hypothetical protein